MDPLYTHTWGMVENLSTIELYLVGFSSVQLKLRFTVTPDQHNAYTIKDLYFTFSGQFYHIVQNKKSAKFMLLCRLKINFPDIVNKAFFVFFIEILN